MNFENTKKYIDKLIKDINLPYFDIVVMKNHETLYRYYNGISKNINGKEKMYMMSCTKPITTAAFMKLIEDKKIDLDDYVVKYLPEFEKAYVLENGNKKYVGNSMTVRHLVTMSAGFDYNFNAKPIMDLLKETNGKASTREVVAKFIESPLSFKPGERFQYSLCHDVLAAAMEVASKERFSDYLQKEIFDPIGMNNSHIKQELKAKDLYPIYDCRYLKDEFRLAALGPYLGYENYESGGAALISTVEDYIKFADTMACGGITSSGKQILKNETIKLWTTEQFSSIDVKNGFTCVQGKDYSYGLGVRVRTIDTEFGLPKGEFGWDGAAGAYVSIDPKNHISCFYAQHVLGHGWIYTDVHPVLRDTMYYISGICKE